MIKRNAKLGLNRWKDVFNDRKIKMAKLGYSVNEYVTPKLQLETQFELQGMIKQYSTLL